ncbi:uracil-DNA glycosylase family protein [Cellulomonas sp. P5_C5]
MQVTADGARTLTLADLWPEPCTAVIVGVNPAPRSVEAGHYYQGSDVRRALSRLRTAGLLPPDSGGFADDEAMAAGIGFTDVVKRPTRRSTELSPRELADGRARLRVDLEARRVPLVVCVFKPAVEALLGHAGPPGFQAVAVAGSRVFRMPGPYAPSADAQLAMQELAAHLAGR